MNETMTTVNLYAQCEYTDRQLEERRTHLLNRRRRGRVRDHERLAELLRHVRVEDEVTKVGEERGPDSSSTSVSEGKIGRTGEPTRVQSSSPRHRTSTA